MASSNSTSALATALLAQPDVRGEQSHWLDWRLAAASMVRVCADSSCKVSARFNTPGERRGMFCSKHKQPGMVDVIHARCAMNGCEVLASFNVEGCPRGVLCSVHKQARPARRPGADVGDLGSGGRWGRKAPSWGGALLLAATVSTASLCLAMALEFGCLGHSMVMLAPAHSCLIVTKRMCACRRAW